jgi:hypothetical protein
MFLRKSLFNIASLPFEVTKGLNESARKQGYPEVFIGNNLNTDYRFVVSNDHIGTVWRWSPMGLHVDKVMFYYMSDNHKEVWFFTDGRIS